ncbi:TonB-dependent SusC/RagA subfamily outer membrane receptor [Arcticibacter tournemirensis]|uniref:TonB-dependent receptor plug domain-containing protein n=1 Tax=Arcticibacter tournemirensis TaxID=699437 RepID=A0A5M9GPY7_9SPHI|nr:TonB-dependent receptor plug domain-containing protein [Arcticibacter tournemirensis]KAA8474824.1 TonB-dependent receptor plug domain-containing protein [Arcticibacter tournemirensis]TQM49651.1 TonB-dependent SusC/RagA subfamily outer membrane receptor [Arcticibacter tournemirensis]
MKHHYLFLVIVLIAPLSVRSQSLIRGRVLSFDEKLPLPGAVIRVTGNSKVLSTDANGMFALQVSNKQVKIEISFVGYKKQVVETVSAIKDTLYIFLHPDVSELQEVVISDGYRKTSGERFTGSFVQIDNEMFNRQVSTDVLSRLEAIAGGVSVDRGTNGTSGRIMIRGLSTIQGPKEVLVILDNFPYDGDINNINPNDVESISVLKDAAASSIWGARAANGVIVINTKKGTFNQPLAISVTGNITTGKKPSLNYIPQMSSADFIEVEKVLFNNGYYEDKINAVNHPVLSPVVELLTRRSSANTADQQAIDNQIELFKNTDIRNEFDQHIYQPSFRQQYAINLTAGSQAAHWTASSGIDRNTDNLDANLSRANLRFQSVLKPFKVLDLTAGLLYTESRTKNGKPGYGEINSAGGAFLPYLRLADDRQAPLSIPKDWRKAFLDTIGGGRLLDWNYYPLEDYKHSGISGLTKDVLINLGASFEPLKGLKADLKYVHEMQNYSGRTLYDSQSYFARNLVNTYTAINGDGSVTYNIPLGGIFDQSDTKMSSDNIRGQLNYSAICG